MQAILAKLGPGDEKGWRTNLHAFRRLLLFHMAARAHLTFLMNGTVGTVESVADISRWLMLFVGTVGCFSRFTSITTRLAAVLLIVDIGNTLPFTANHVFLEFFLFAFFSFLNEEDEHEGPLLLQSLRWFIAVFFFYTGLQKLFYGYYFDGQFLTYMTGTKRWFAAFFGKFISSDELQRLMSYNERLLRPELAQPRIGAGPYRVDSAMFVVMSNAVYVFEILAGIGLLVARTRVFAALASIAFVVMIECGARELTFGVLMLNLLLLFLPGAWVKRLFPFCVAVYIFLLAMAMGVIPQLFDYSPA
jgi:uncharacterized membrane protein YphA (DoxX/SURF4 family)